MTREKLKPCEFSSISASNKSLFPNKRGPYIKQNMSKQLYYHMYRLLYLKIDIKQSKFNLLNVDVPDLLPKMDFCCQFVLYLKENKT